MKCSLICLVCLFYSANGFADVCGRSTNVILALEWKLEKKCDQISSKELATVTELRVVRWVGNEPVRSGDFDGLTHLEKLEAESGFDHEIPANTIQNLSSLKYLNMSWGQVEELPLGVFDQLTQLKHLDFAYHPIKYFDKHVFKQLKELKFLNFQMNVNTLPKDIFSELTLLEQLFFDSVEVEFKKLPQINYLPPQILHSLKSLKELGIGGRIERLDKNFLIHQPQLESINIASKLKEIPDDFLANNPKLKLVYFWFNELTNIPVGLFDHLSMVREIVLTHNQINKETKKRLKAKFGNKISF